MRLILFSLSGGAMSLLNFAESGRCCEFDEFC